MLGKSVAKVKQINLKYKHRKIIGNFSLSGSKSVSNRLLVMRALAESKMQFGNLSTSADSQLLKSYLKLIIVCASSAIPMVIDAKNAGTVFRFLAAYLAINEGVWLLTGNKRMKERPIEGLALALDNLGVEITYAGKNNFAPLRIVGSDIDGGSVEVDPSASSQFVSALMLIAPYLEKGLQIQMKKKPVSFSYILMTQKLMQEFGAKVQVQKNKVVVESGEYQMKTYQIEPDWSSTSYFYEMAALSENADIFLSGFSSDSVQGDRVAVEVFEQLGVITSFENNGIRLKSGAHSTSSFSYDFTSCPDLVPAVLASCAGKGIHAVLKGVGHLKYKESDRIASMQAELFKTGTILKRKANSVELIPSEIDLSKSHCVFDTCGDHRIAMSLAPLVLKLASVKINNPEVVSKSYPLFWDDMERLGIKKEEIELTTDN